MMEKGLRRGALQGLLTCLLQHGICIAKHQADCWQRGIEPDDDVLGIALPT